MKSHAILRIAGGICAASVLTLSLALPFGASRAAADPADADQVVYAETEEDRGPQLPWPDEAEIEARDQEVSSHLVSSFEASSLPGSAEAMCEVALAEPNGAPEGGRYNKYNALFNHGGYDWCGCFITWCARQAGVSTDVIPNICLTTAMVQFYQNQGVWHDSSYVPKAGDLIFFDSSGSGYVSHVGLVTGVEDGYILTKEGNTGSSGGGQVGSTKNLPVGSTGLPQYGRHIYGFASPNYPVCLHPYWHAEDTWYHYCDLDEMHYVDYLQVCDDCGKVVGDVRNDIEMCEYEWNGVELECTKCGQELVVTTPNAEYFAAWDTVLYGDEDLTDGVDEIPTDTVLQVGEVFFNGENWVGEVTFGDQGGYVRMADLRNNGNAGFHRFVNGVCIDCGRQQASTRPGVYAATDNNHLVYESTPVSAVSAAMAVGDKVVVSEVKPSTYYWLWGITPEGNVTDMLGLKPLAERIAGIYAEHTSAEICKETFERSDYVVVARDDDFADAMGATGLAGTLSAPIVLSDRHFLGEDAADAVKSVEAKYAYIIGGPGAVDYAVDEGLEELGLTVRRIYGTNSYDTSMACARLIAEWGGSTDEAIVAMSTNFQDALSMSSYAYKYKVPIVLQTWGDTSADRGFTDEEQAFLQGKNLLVAGGTGAVSDESLEGMTVRARLWGEDGYDTSNAIAKWMTEQGYLSPRVVVLACGAQGPCGVDALAGAALAGRASAPMLLVNTNTELDGTRTVVIDDYLASQKGNVTHAYVLGGQFVMPDDILATLSDYV